MNFSSILEVCLKPFYQGGSEDKHNFSKDQGQSALHILFPSPVASATEVKPFCDRNITQMSSEDTPVISCSKYASDSIRKKAQDLASSQKISLMPPSEVKSPLSDGLSKKHSVDPKQAFNSDNSKPNSTSKKPEALEITPYSSVMQYLPGVTNILYVPYEFISAINALPESSKNNNTESKIDALLRISQAPFCMVNALGSLYTYTVFVLSKITKNINAISVFGTVVSKITFIFGLIVTIIEAIIEIIGMVRSINLFRDPLFSIQGFIKKLKKAPTLEKQKDLIKQQIKYMKDNEKTLLKKYGYLGYGRILRTLHSYEKELDSPKQKASVEKLEAKLLLHHLEIFRRKNMDPAPTETEKIINLEKAESNKLRKKRKLEQLASRIHPWAVEKIENDIDFILDGLNSSDPNIKELSIKNANELIDKIKTQNIKKILIHTIGLVAIALTFVALFLSLILMFNPVFLPLTAAIVLPNVFFWSGFALSIIHFCANKGFMSCEGWHFSLKKTLPSVPDFVKSIVHRIKIKFFKSKNELSSSDIELEETSNVG